jgi:hypothetical protein
VSGRKRAFGALLLRALVASVPSLAIVGPARAKNRFSIAPRTATVSVVHDAPGDDLGLEAPADEVRVMPAPLSRRVPAPATVHELAALSARSIVVVADEVARRGAECAARCIRIWRRFLRMAPEEPPLLALVS